MEGGEASRKVWYALVNEDGSPYRKCSTHMIPTSVLTLFIASPRAASYRKYVDHHMPMKFCFPIWTTDELEKCRVLCYPSFSPETLQARYEVYGGIARYIFDLSYSGQNQLVNMDKLEDVLSNR